jgi:hypothetical protein
VAECDLSAGGVLVCTGCKRELPRGSFHKNTKNSSGLKSRCRECRSEDARKRYAADRRGIIDRGKSWRAKNVTRSVANGLIHVARARAKKKRLAFNLCGCRKEICAILDRGNCEITRLEFHLGGGRRRWNSPSIDRIDPGKGYVWGNVRVVCWMTNAAMGDWGEAVALEVMRVWLDSRGQNA